MPKFGKPKVSSTIIIWKLILGARHNDSQKLTIFIDTKWCIISQVTFAFLQRSVFSGAIGLKMMRKEKKKKQEFCQSRFYKDWNPDIMADYNRWQDDNDYDPDDDDKTK